MAAPRSARGIRSRRHPRWPKRSRATATAIGVDPETSKNKFAIVQAEDELASIGMVIGAAWNGARAFTATSGPGISLMQEFVGPGVFRRDPRGDLRRAARRPVHRHADPHAAVRHSELRLRLARRHQARAAVPGRPARVLRVRRAGVRSGGPAADADLRDARSRDRHERAAVQAVHLGRQPQAGPRQGDDRRGAGGRQGFRPLPRRRRRRHPLSHLSRHASDARRVLHPRHLEGPPRALQRGRSATTSRTCSGC